MADMHYLIFSELVSLRHKVVFDPMKGRWSHCMFSFFPLKFEQMFKQFKFQVLSFKNSK